MLQPDEVTASLRERFHRDYPSWARDIGTWPLRINLRPPTTDQRATDPVACHRWAATWNAYTGPGTVEHTNMRFSTGTTHPMPKTLILSRASHVAAAHPDTQATWRICGQRLTRLHRAFPQATFDRIVRRITELPDDDFERLHDTADWLVRNPVSGLLLRQLPIEGIHTKWLHRHQTLVLGLLGAEPSAEGTEPDTGLDSADNDQVSSARRRLHERLGLRTQPELVNIAVLDPDLRAGVGGMRHFAASTDDLNQWSRQPTTIIIIENKETGYAFTDDLPGTVIFHGNGANVAAYARISWLRTATTVIYWGDIDAPGLHFVNDLRSRGINASSALMDTPTLTTYERLTTTGAALYRTELPHLTPTEADLYRHLTQQPSGLLLEQERIPWQHAIGEILAMISASAEFPPQHGHPS